MRQPTTVVFAVSLVALPGVFTIFPEVAQQVPLWLKALLVGLWLVIVTLSARGALAQGERIDELVGAARERRAKQKQLAARRLLTLHLTKDIGLPEGHKFHLYMPDEANQELVAVFAPEPRPPSWKFGQGVTGEAWRRQAYVHARGTQTHDETFHLTEEQKRRHADLGVVAALPVLDDRGNPIAILTGSSPIDDGHLVSADGYDRHQELAQIAGRVLMDVAELPR